MYPFHEDEHADTFYCVFCKNVKDHAEHGGQTNESGGDICQACLRGDDAVARSWPAAAGADASAPLDETDKCALREMIYANLEAFVDACKLSADCSPDAQALASEA